MIFRSSLSHRLLQWAWDHRPSKKWVIGAAIATPVAAVVQGVILLQDFRERHSDAPTPITPSRGVIVTVPNNNYQKENNGSSRNPSVSATKLRELMAQSVSNTATLLEQISQEPPLRILIIGDSLAAGVGVSQTGIPVLPESIARALSQRLGGRPVYWTCVGTPGASAARIVHDIQSYRESLLVRQPTVPTELLVTESWIQGVQRQMKNITARRDRLRDWWQTLGGDAGGNDDDEEQESNEKDKSDDSLVESSNGDSNAMENTNETKTNQKKQHDDNDKNEKNKPRPMPIVRWWRRVKRGAKTFRKAWSGDPKQSGTNHPNTDQKNNKKDGDNSEDDEEAKDLVDPFHLWQRWRQRLQRRSSLRNPEIVGQFDVAIVLTGLNDLKEATLPFMFRGRNATLNPKGEEEKGVMVGLERVLEALQQRMTLALDRAGGKETKSQKEEEKEVGYTLDDDNINVEKELLQSIRESESRLALQSHGTTRRRPLVVFPALPVSALPIFHSAPLRWFALPLFRRVDSYKRQVAARFPGEVLFVDTPTDDEFSEIEQGTGALWDERRREQVLLRLTDITQKARERVEEVMKEHYKKWAKTIGTKESHCYNHPTPEEAQNSSEMERSHRPGNSLISVDGVHPNDDGYEFWGRHIALAIVEEWNKQDEARQNE